MQLCAPQQKGMLSARVQKAWPALCHTWNRTSPGTIVISVPLLVLIILHQQTLKLLACPVLWNHSIKSCSASQTACLQLHPVTLLQLLVK